MLLWGCLSHSTAAIGAGWYRAVRCVDGRLGHSNGCRDAARLLRLRPDQTGRHRAHHGPMLGWRGGRRGECGRSEAGANGQRSASSPAAGSRGRLPAHSPTTSTAACLCAAWPSGGAPVGDTGVLPARAGISLRNIPQRQSPELAPMLGAPAATHSRQPAQSRPWPPPR